MKVTVFILAAVLAAFPYSLAQARGGKTYGDMAEVIYLGNYDGDTIRFDIPGVHPLLGKNISIRVRDVDTPEIRAKCPVEKTIAMDAKKRIRQLLEKAKRITLKETGRGKYFRIVARVVADGVDVGTVLLKEGLAVSYRGGKKIKNWCIGANKTSTPMTTR